MDRITTYLFTVEAVLKILAYGFLFNGKNSYLRSFSNSFDFIIVLSSLAYQYFGGDTAQKLSKLKTLRTIRVMRPLRFVSRSHRLKVALATLVSSVP